MAPHNALTIRRRVSPERSYVPAPGKGYYEVGRAVPQHSSGGEVAHERRNFDVNTSWSLRLPARIPEPWWSARGRPGCPSRGAHRGKPGILRCSRSRRHTPYTSYWTPVTIPGYYGGGKLRVNKCYKIPLEIARTQEGTGLNLAMMTRVALMAAVTAVAAQASSYLFSSGSFYSAGLRGRNWRVSLLGPRYGALAMGIYLLVGAVGMPVFHGVQGRPFGHLLGPTGGYLVSYPLAAAIAGLAAYAAAKAGRRRALAASFVAGAAALVVIYAFGVVWLVVVTQLPFAVATGAGRFAVRGVRPDQGRPRRARSGRRRPQFIAPSRT